MAYVPYTKTVWEDGDLITKAKMNNFEDELERLSLDMKEVDNINTTMTTTSNGFTITNTDRTNHTTTINYTLPNITMTTETNTVTINVTDSTGTTKTQTIQAVVGDDYNTLYAAIGDLKNAIDEISEKIDEAVVTDNLDHTSEGITMKRVSDSEIKVYGTATASRYFCFLNGQASVKTSAGAFNKTLDEGTYLIKLNMTGATPLGSLRVTYSTFADTFLTVTANTEVWATFDNPVMIGFLTINGRDYGTENDPTILSFSIQQLIGKDPIAREEAESKYNRGTIDYSKIATSGTFIVGDGSMWGSSIIAQCSVFRIPACIKKIHVTANADNTRIAFLNSYNSPAVYDNVDYSDAYGNLITLAANESADYIPSGNMNYFYAYVKNTSSNNVAPDVVLYADEIELNPVDVETEDESGKVDLASEFDVLLNAFTELHIHKGVYYVSGIHVPEKGKLIGSGFNSTIKLLASIGSGSAVYMGPSSIVKDVQIKGGDSSQWVISSEGSRNGIEWTGEEQTAGIVDGCFITNFSGSGIYLHDTTQKTYRCLSIANCYVTGNYVGIDIRKDSEFNKICNCTITGNHIGYRNRGGNNDISNCGIDANRTGILIDADVGGNNGHGTITGCSINHSGSNSGYGLIIKDTGRMMVSNCNIYFSKLKLDNTDGNVISNCGFGTSASWEIINGACSLFIGCMVRGWDAGNTNVTVTNNSAVKIDNCYDRTGVSYTV